MLEEVGDRLGLCVDTGHCLYSGVDTLGLLERHRRRVWHVHLKDLRADLLIRPRSTRHELRGGGRAGVFCPFGDGDVDLRAFLDALRRIGYRGWGTYEQDRVASDHATARPDAERSLAHLDHLAGILGSNCHERARAARHRHRTGRGRLDGQRPRFGVPPCSRALPRAPGEATTGDRRRPARDAGSGGSRALRLRSVDRPPPPK